MRPIILACAAVLAIAAAAAGFFRWFAGSTTAGPRPGAAAGFNLLFITLDTVRPDHLGCYGYTAARTPNLDSLAARGVRFAHAIAPAPLTLPSHASMLTGLDPPSHGARDNGTFRLADNYTTLAEALTARGYATAAFIGSFILDRRFGLAQGFATYDDLCPPSDGPAEPGGEAVNRRPAEAVTNAALAWLDGAAQRGQPFFAWIHYFDAHYPCAPPPAFARYFPNRPYDAEIASIDSQIGRVLDLLGRSGADRRTLIIVASDHGEGLEEHGEPTHAYLAYDSTLRAALILNNPALLGGPRVVDDRVVGLVDITPTVLDWFGIPAPGPRDGRPLLAGKADPNRAIYFETMAPRLNCGWASLHGLHRLHDKYTKAPRPEYFDLRRDPGELNNLAGTELAGMRELEAQLAKLMDRWPPPEQVAAHAAALPPEDQRRLAALGYVSAAADGTPIGVADPKDMFPIWKRMMAADTLSQQGQHAQAIAEIEAVLRDDPADGRAWQYAASVYKRCGRLDAAENAARRSAQLSPTAVNCVNLAQLLLVRGTGGDELPRVLDAAQKLDPSHGGTYIARGDWLVLQGRLREALAQFEEALRVDPTNSGRTARAKIEWVKRNLSVPANP